MRAHAPKESASCCRRPRPRTARGAERRARLPLRLRAQRARDARPERGGAARARVRPRPLLRRVAASLRARRHAPERALRELAETLKRADGRDRRRARARPAPRRAPGRPRRRPLPHLARRLRARAARQPRVRCCAPDEMLDASPTTAKQSRGRPSSPTAAVRPDRGARLPLSRLLRRRRAGDRAAARASASTPSTSATRANGHKQRVRTRLDEELQLIDELGLAGFFLLHWEVLELAREVRARGRGPDRCGTCCRPGGARLLGRLARLLPDRPLARRPGRERTSRSAAS